MADRTDRFHGSRYVPDPRERASSDEDSLAPTELLVHSLENLRSSNVLDGSAGSRQPTARRRDNLAGSIARRAVIEQAKGVLILRYGVDSGQAHTILRRWASEADVKLEVLADAMIRGVCQEVDGHTIDPHLVRWLQEALHPQVSPDGDRGDDVERGLPPTDGHAAPSPLA
jgi:hypothetical protein